MNSSRKTDEQWLENESYVETVKRLTWAANDLERLGQHCTAARIRRVLTHDRQLEERLAGRDGAS